MDANQIPQETVEKRNKLSITGQIFRILFYLFLLYLIWLFFPLPSSLKEVGLNLTEALKTLGSALLALSVVYSLLTPHEEDYEKWGWFAIWLTVGTLALYGISFLL